jgi:hypothetical protein
MKLGLLGELTRDEHVPEWLVSSPVDVPLLGLPLRFVIDGLEEDQAPAAFEDAVSTFLRLGAKDRKEATPHVFQNYRRFVDAVPDCELHLSSPEHVWTHVRFTEVRVTRRHRGDEKVYVQATAECDWEVEHGLQLVFREGRRLTRVSSQDGHLTYADACGLPDSEDAITTPVPGTNLRARKRWWNLW